MPSSSSLSPPDGGRSGAAEEGGGGGRLEDVAALGLNWVLETPIGALSGKIRKKTIGVIFSSSIN